MNPSLSRLCKPWHQARAISRMIAPDQRPLRPKAARGAKFPCIVGMHLAFLACCISPMSFAQGCKNLPTVSELLLADQTDMGLKVPLEKIKANRKARLAKLDKIIECYQIKSAWDWRKASTLASQGNEESDLFRAMEYANHAVQRDPESRAAQLMAATAWDRILVSRGLPQWYGTLFKGKTPLPIARCVIKNEIRRHLGIGQEVIATQPEVCTDRF